MADAGKFPKTVELHDFAEGSKDGLGHKQRTYTLFRKCAARLWERSAALLEANPAEFPAGVLRLLLRLPPKEMLIGWRVVYSSVTYEIRDLDWRDNDDNCLITVDKV